MKTRKLLVVVGIATVVGSACSTRAKQGDGKGESTAERISAALADSGELEKVFSEIAQDMPELAGFYFAEPNRLVVAVTRGTEEARAEAVATVVRARIGERAAARIAGKAKEGEGPPEVELYRQAQFSFVQLAKWREEMRSALGIDGVVLVALDERRNRVVVRVADGSAHTGLEKLIRESSVPRAAVLIEADEAPALRTYARKYRRAAGEQSGAEESAPEKSDREETAKSRELPPIDLPGERAPFHL